MNGRLQGANYTNVEVRLKARIVYTLSTTGGTPPTATGQVNWGVTFFFDVSATNPNGQAIQQDIRFRFLSGSFTKADLVGFMVR